VYDIVLDEYHSIPCYNISHFAYWIDTGKLYIHGGFIGNFGRANDAAIEVEILDMIQYQQYLRLNYFNSLLKMMMGRM